jgi:ABC-type taurine transport system ATPase subunit
MANVPCTRSALSLTAWMGVLAAETVRVNTGLGTIVTVGCRLMNMNPTFLGLVTIGPSGCGESTLLMMLAGLEMPTSRGIVYNGRAVSGPGADRSLIFQQPSLYPWLSALDSVASGLMLQGVGRKERRQRAEQFLRRVGLREFAHKHRHELSGAMQQRAAIVRASCLGADVLLMDEPLTWNPAFTCRASCSTSGRGRGEP